MIPHPRIVLAAVVLSSIVLAAGDVAAQSPRVTLDQVRLELGSMGFHPGETQEDSEGNSWFTYRAGSRAPETRVELKGCNGSGCSQVIFRQELVGPCVEEPCTGLPRAYRPSWARRLATSDFARWHNPEEGVTLRLEDRSNHQRVQLEQVWRAGGSQRVDQAAFQADLRRVDIWSVLWPRGN